MADRAYNHHDHGLVQDHDLSNHVYVLEISLRSRPQGLSLPPPRLGQGLFPRWTPSSEL